MRRSLAFGGTNAHVVLKHAPFWKVNDAELADSIVQERTLFILSTNDKAALKAMIKNLGIYLEQRPEVFQSDLMSNVAYTLGQRRIVNAMASYDSSFATF